MPANKKPRKPYVKRAKRIPLGFTQTQLATMGDLLTQVGIIAEIKLPRGTCTDNDLHCIQDVINWGGFGLFRSWVDEETREYGLKFQRAAAEAMHDVVMRKRTGKTQGYVCKASELHAMQDCLELFIPMLKDAIAGTPRKSYYEFFASQAAAETGHKRRVAKEKENGIFYEGQD
jgi:hypothetical protein